MSYLSLYKEKYINRYISLYTNKNNKNIIMDRKTNTNNTATINVNANLYERCRRFANYT